MMNPVVHFEMPYRDRDRAARFYADVFGWKMDKLGPDKFVFGTEESHGYLVGQYCRDKDGAVACMLMSELAALVKSKGQLKDIERKIFGKLERVDT